MLSGSVCVFVPPPFLNFTEKFLSTVPAPAALLESIRREDVLFPYLGQNIKWEREISGDRCGHGSRTQRREAGRRKNRKFREKDQIKVFSCTFLHKGKIAVALICSNAGGLSVPGERRGVQCSRRWASLNVSASCNTSPETLGSLINSGPGRCFNVNYS